MKKLEAAYRILKTLDKYQGKEEFNNQMISADKVGLGYEEWEQLLILMAKRGLIEGVAYEQTPSNPQPKIVEPVHPLITWEGLEYLEIDRVVVRGFSKCQPEVLKQAGEIF